MAGKRTSSRRVAVATIGLGVVLALLAFLVGPWLRGAPEQIGSGKVIVEAPPVVSATAPIQATKSHAF